MNRKKILIIAITGVLSLGLDAVIAAETEKEQAQIQMQEQEKKQIYGWELMSVEERAAHRAILNSFATEEEREAYRTEHHEKMQKRAEAQGVTLPEAPAQRGSGQGSGSGGGGGGGGGGGKGN
ncbi:MAG: hypothetical protein L0Z73_11045 [Gammaproteobacteria bacterium]|nr:hypothetical protein [Gammaproteobacteria bacterium]